MSNMHASTPPRLQLCSTHGARARVCVTCERSVAWRVCVPVCVCDVLVLVLVLVVWELRLAACVEVEPVDRPLLVHHL